MKPHYLSSRVLAAFIFLVALGVFTLWLFMSPSTIMAQQAATPTPGITVITPTPQPPDVFAAATQSIRLTEQAQREGTPTPLPRNLRVATRTPTARVVTATPTAANQATATYHAMISTAIALTTGTPYVRVATATNTPSPKPTVFVVTPTPRPANVFVEATRKAERELQAQQGTLPTPLPDYIVVATVTQTPRVVTNTPPPENDATATVQSLHATAVAYTTGVPNIVTATPTYTPTPRPSTPTPTWIPTEIPLATATTVEATVVAEEADFAPVPDWTEIDRIRFPRNTTNTTIRGYVADDQPMRFVLHARTEQLMTIRLSNDGNYLARVDIHAEDGELIGSAYAGDEWRATLPDTQDYYLTLRVASGERGHDFALWVEIAP